MKSRKLLLVTTALAIFSSLSACAAPGTSSALHVAQTESIKAERGIPSLLQPSYGALGDPSRRVAPVQRVNRAG